MYRLDLNLLCSHPLPTSKYLHQFSQIISEFMSATFPIANSSFMFKAFLVKDVLVLFLKKFYF